ncbi:MAG: UDP-N-acetylmuramoyl-L-alanine--D-glutamate ligase, partial [Parasporobacterium sp.]|nr:UDP-N-acetylmuramoyl-L-alanine--D-glutamate ligase [Parasporobacterium sp.]
MDFKNKNILVYGMGVSGRGAASMLHAMDLPAVLFDSNMDLDQEALIEKLGFEPEEIVTGELTDLRLDHTDILVLSPGVSAFAPDIERARAKGVTIIGEIELAYQLS